MSENVLDRIDAWEAAGLIDAATAERLRSAELAAGSPAKGAPPASRTGVVSSLFSPPLTIVEVFSYLGGAFVLAAWAVLIGRVSSQSIGSTQDWLRVMGFAVPAAVFFLGGILLHPRSPRLSRAAGISFVVSVLAIGAGVTANANMFTPPDMATLAGATAALLAATAYRWLHVSMPTHLALLATITWFTWSILALIDGGFDVTRTIVFGTVELSNGLVGAVVSAVGWTMCALVIGLVGLAESRSGGAAGRARAALARFWAGLVLVIGVAVAVMRSSYDPESGLSVRVIEPLVGELIVLGVSAILIERAFRREAGAFVVPAALGIVIALTDFNFSYVAKVGGTEVALLVEGLLLIAIAFGAERISRRVSNGEPPGAADSEGADTETAPA